MDGWITMNTRDAEEKEWSIIKGEHAEIQYIQLGDY